MSRRENAAAAAKVAEHDAAAQAEWLKLPLITRQGIKAGAAERLRQHAADVVAVNRALEAEGLPGSYVMPELDPETGEHLDAREVLAEAERRAPQHRKGRWTPADDRRMTSADLARIGGYAAVCARRMTRGEMGEAELDDVASTAIVAALTRTTEDSPAERRAARSWLAAPYGTPRADARLWLMEDRLTALPRWNALDRIDLDGTPHADAAQGSRDKWRGLAFQQARRSVKVYRERVKAEHAADWSDAGEDDPTPEQKAAQAAEQATAYVVESLADAALSAYFLSATAPGGKLRAAERDALALRVAGLTRAELAAARGVDAEAVKKNAQRGVKHLERRLPDARSDVAKWARKAEHRADNVLAVPTHADKLARVMAPAWTPYKAVRLAWPDRMAEYPEDGSISLPTRQGKGEHKRVPACPHGPAERHAGTPRRTRSGAPVLPWHAAMRVHARGARIARRVNLPTDPRTAEHYADPLPEHYRKGDAAHMSEATGEKARAAHRARWRSIDGRDSTRVYVDAYTAAWRAGKSASAATRAARAAVKRAGI